jgi:multiple sugar transport system permease protein
MAIDMQQASSRIQEQRLDAPPVARRKTLWQRAWHERAAYLLILPAFLGFVVFWLIPAAFAFIASFTKYDAFTMVWTGEPLYNYARILRDRVVGRSYLNVLQYVIITLGAGQTLALLLALALNSLRRGAALFRTIYYLPVITSIVAIATVFRWLFASDEFGIINQALKTASGLGPVRWLYEDALFIPVLSLIAIWAGFGFNTLIWMAGLRAIPPEYYEVARMDGASNWQQFWAITLPLLKPVVVFQAVLGFIGGMKEFGLVLVLTSAGTGGVGVVSDAAMTPVLMIYRYGFINFQMGYASALAFLLTLILIVVSVLQLRLYGRQETYD